MGIGRPVVWRAANCMGKCFVSVCLTWGAGVACAWFLAAGKGFEQISGTINRILQYTGRKPEIFSGFLYGNLYVENTDKNYCRNGQSEKSVRVKLMAFLQKMEEPVDNRALIE